MQNFATAAPIAVVLDVPAGLIRFIAADRADTTVEILPADASKSRDVKAAEQTSAEYSNGVLRIAAAPAKNRVLGNHPGSVEITVQLPAGSTSRRRPRPPSSAASGASATSPSRAPRARSSSTRPRAPTSP